MNFNIRRSLPQEDFLFFEQGVVLMYSFSKQIQIYVFTHIILLLVILLYFCVFVVDGFLWSANVCYFNMIFSRRSVEIRV